MVFWFLKFIFKFSFFVSLVSGIAFQVSVTLVVHCILGFDILVELPGPCLSFTIIYFLLPHFLHIVYFPFFLRPHALLACHCTLLFLYGRLF